MGFLFTHFAFFDSFALTCAEHGPSQSLMVFIQSTAKSSKRFGS